MTRKRYFEVGKRTRRDLDIVDSRGKHHKFWDQVGGTAPFYYITDPGIAQEIDAKYGKGGTQEVWVKEHDRVGWFNRTKEPGGIHNYAFGFNKAFAEGWEHIFGKKRKDAGEMPEV
jgi:hypothetical protein